MDFTDNVSRQSLRSGDVKKNTEANITTAQNQALRKNRIKSNIDRADCTPCSTYIEYISLWMSHPCTLQQNARSYKINAI